ncbi:AraC family transcriptional regulator [Alysiella filiformis]|uniref:AraC-type DNA-binding protein n=1 Tax=Alysiella filiformis DSM 16848 TaxID=1120981 RepID=A0A286EDN3_9NEIS|nr:AraC family transcriptional regulator [Alysiella filiformis]QMT31708.1 AraC family transcriptional regulator [Alysiella filiformis]UBQ55281.1 AraC family transcriptional regulator [Alysiella filiformis DSM 16848]SOD69016.1 AraC-type DNA-binding protein [Alysiella filiformis DSM 16848]
MHALIQEMLGFLQKDEIKALPEVGLTLYRCDTPIPQISYLQEPAVCFILRGQKTVYWGENCLSYGDGQYMCYSVELPITGEVLGASENYPYVGIQMKLNAPILLQLMIDLGKSSAHFSSDSPAQIGTINEPMINALHRLANLACSPSDVAILAPLIQRELHYHLLKSEMADRLYQMVAVGGNVAKIAQSIAFLKANFRQTLTIEMLANQVNMSVPNFYRHFRQVTAISPLQYQKSLRLTEARQRIKQKQGTLAQIAHDVGYESSSQFSREYKRMFGISPSADFQAA